MPWGKYRGHHLDEVPTGYLAWLLDEGRRLDLALRRAVCRELAERLGIEPAPASGRGLPPRPEVADAAANIIAAGYRVVALKSHPDQGGKHEDMIAATEARDWLRARVKA